MSPAHGGTSGFILAKSKLCSQEAGPSMRTHSGEVIRGRWRNSLSGGGLSEAFAADIVAVPVCCTHRVLCIPQVVVPKAGLVIYRRICEGMDHP